jgi:hypothetical protein
VSFSYDAAGGTEVSKVRLLVPDRIEAGANFQDEEIESFLSLEGSSVKRAAALAKETIAGDQVMLLKVISHLDVSTDGAAVARELRLQATELRAQAEADEEEEGEGVDVIEMELGAFSTREQIVNEAVRDA